MKLLIVTTNYPKKNKPFNGIFIHLQVKALQQLGVECHVLQLHKWYPPFGLHKLHGYWKDGYHAKQQLFEEYEGVRVHAVPVFVRMPARFFNDNHYERSAQAIVNYVRKHKELADATWMYAHFLTDSGFIAAKAKDVLGMKLAAITRGDDVHAWPEHHPNLIPNIRYVFEHADLMLANNKALARDAMKFVDKVVPQFKIAYNGINYEEFAPGPMSAGEDETLRLKYGLPEGKKILLCIATAEYMKGWGELLDAMAECRDEMQEWVLLAIANKHFSRLGINIEEKVAQLGIEDKVRVHSFVPHDEVKQLYRLANAFILPSYNEGISNAVMEAMASGLWTITTDVGGHSEIIENNISAFLIKPKSKEAVKSSLLYLAHNYETRKDEMRNEAIVAMKKVGSYVENARILIGYMRQG